jgi:SMODS and SLOG-associating 2TM effector domain 2
MRRDVVDGRNGPTAAAPHRRWRRGDLRIAALPALSVEDWQHPDVVLDQLRRWAETHAEEAIEWYLRDKRAKRLGSRLLRGLTIILAIAGGLVPLLMAGQNGRATDWGYVLLALAGGSAAFDHFFGLSSGWMRDMATLQALQRRLLEFRLTWITTLTTGKAAADGSEISTRLELIRRFALDVSELVSGETGDWLAEFQTNVGQLRNEAGRAWPNSAAPPSRSAGESAPTRLG